VLEIVLCVFKYLYECMCLYVGVHVIYVRCGDEIVVYIMFCGESVQFVKYVNS
jgi:hypothetical protein